MVNKNMKVIDTFQEKWMAEAVGETVHQRHNRRYLVKASVFGTGWTLFVEVGEHGEVETRILLELVAASLAVKWAGKIQVEALEV